MILIICISLILTGCIIRTLYPIYDSESIIYSNLVSGVWKKLPEKEEWAEYWYFAYDEDGLYNFDLITKHKKDDKYEIDTSYFEAVLCRINDEMYLDLTPDNKKVFRGNYTNKFDCAFLIPSHTFLKVEIRNDSLFFYEPRYDIIENILVSNKNKLGFKRFGKSDFIITAETDELKNFISDPLIHNQIFNDTPQILIRK